MQKFSLHFMNYRQFHRVFTQLMNWFKVKIILLIDFCTSLISIYLFLDEKVSLNLSTYGQRHRGKNTHDR